MNTATTVNRVVVLERDHVEAERRNALARPPGADEALDELRRGNARYTAATRPMLEIGAWDPETNPPPQSPIAVVVCCSDSRVPPELVFWQGLGYLFVTRVAGNTVDAAALGSIVYAVTSFGTPLVVVLGHERCGAVQAAVDFVVEDVPYPDVMAGIVEPIIPAVIAASKESHPGGDLCEAAMRANVDRTVKALSETLQVVLRNAEGPDRLLVVGARYDVNDGTVRFFQPVAVEAGRGS